MQTRSEGYQFSLIRTIKWGIGNGHEVQAVGVQDICKDIEGMRLKYRVSVGALGSMPIDTLKYFYVS